MCLILGFSIIVLLSYFAEIFFLKSLAEITLVHSRHSRAGGKPGLPCIPAWIPGRATPDYDPGLPGMTQRIVAASVIRDCLNSVESFPSQWRRLHDTNQKAPTTLSPHPEPIVVSRRSRTRKEKAETCRCAPRPPAGAHRSWACHAI